MKNLIIFLDQKGILRMDGRIANSKRYGYGVKYPILLGKHHPYTESLINEFHQQPKHLGISITIAKIRMAGLWIPQAVKTVLSKCTICKKYNSLAFKFPSLRCPWCNGYRCRKWTRRHEFKSWTRLIAFHIALIPLGKV